MRSLLQVATVTAVIATVVAFPAHAQDQRERAQGRQGQVTLAIDSVSPQVARATSTITVSGTVSNGTGNTVAGLSVALQSAGSPFQARDLMDGFVTGEADVPLAGEGAPFTFAAAIAPGRSAAWRASFTVASAGYAQFGVYPVQAVLSSSITGAVLSSGRTLLPYWPGSTAGIAKLTIAWAWPLIDQPHRQACVALTNNDLATSLPPDGRLGALLAAAAANPAAQPTLVIDPALLGDVTTMTRAYQTGGTPDCKLTHAQPASKAAQDWLAGLKNLTRLDPVVITPYANVDVAALVHHRGLTGNLGTAYQLGRETAAQVLGDGVASTDMAVLPGGAADLSVLTTLAATQHITSAVLSASQMPPRDPAAFSPDDAVTTVATSAGTAMKVLLADDTLTALLKQATAATTPDRRFAIEQRFLAETAMIAAEAPQSSRSVVVEPPQTWGPQAQLADRLLAETARAPWLRPVTLMALTTAHDSPAVTRQPLAATRIGHRELGAGYLANVAKLDSRLAVYSSALYQPPAGYTNGLRAALAATESAAWRGGGVRGGRALSARLATYLGTAESKIQIIQAPVIQMAGAAGAVPVTIQNGLHQAIRVQVNAAVTTARGVPNPMNISPGKPITIAPGQARLVKLSVRSAPQGSTTVQLWLSSADGTPLRFASAQLTVDSTRYGQAILILIAAAIGLLLLTSVFRSGRRRKQADGGSP